MSSNRENEQGYIVLITVLVLGIIVSTIAAFLLLTGTNSSISSEAVEGGIEAKSAATGCAELALAAIQASPTLTTPSNGSSTLNAAAQEACTYSISGTTPKYTIVATGNVNQTGKNYIHNETVSTSQTTPSITISSWQDTP